MTQLHNICFKKAELKGSHLSPSRLLVDFKRGHLAMLHKYNVKGQKVYAKANKPNGQCNLASTELMHS